MISKALVRGAYQRKLEELARLPGVELTLVTPPSWIDGGHRVALERRFTRGYDLIVAPIRFEGHFHIYYYPGLTRLIERLRPDVVHADEEPYNLAAYQSIRAARRAGAKALFYAWQNIHRRLPLPFRLMESYAYRNVDYAITANRDAVDVLRRKGYRGSVAIVPGFGVDPDLFRPPEAPPPARPFTVGYLGRLIRPKGLLDLLEAASGLPGEWRLELVGDGPLRPELEARAASLGVAGRVRIRPEVPSTEVPQALADLDVLVLPSVSTASWREQFGRVLIEAMACAVPVVGSDSGEIPHVIGEAGLVFPEGQPDRLRACLARLAADPAERGRLGWLGRERVLSQYTQTRIAAATYEVYREMVAGVRPEAGRGGGPRDESPTG